MEQVELEKIIDTTGLSIGRQLKLKRTLEGKTQQELGTELGVPQSVLSRYEQDITDVLEKHRDAVNCYLSGK